MKGLMVCAFFILQSSYGLSGEAKDILARVNGEVITSSDLDDIVSLLGSQAEPAKRDNVLKAELLDNVINRKLVYHVAMASGVLNDETFKKRLKFIETDVLIDVYLEKEAAKNLTESKLREFFKANRARFEKQEVKISRIYTESRSKAERLYDEVKRSPQKFADVAARDSEDPNSRQTRGDQGYIRFQSDDDPIDQFAFMAKKGAFSPILNLKKGYAIVLVTDTKPGKSVKYESVRADVARLARQRYVESMIKKLRESANVEIRGEVAGEGKDK